MNFRKVFLAAAFAGSILAFGTPQSSYAGDVKVLIHCKKLSYNTVAAKVKAAGGTVRFQYKYVEGIAITIAEEKLREITSSPEVLGCYRDQTFSVPKDPRRERAGYPLPAKTELVAEEVQSLTTAQLKSLVAPSPAGYYPFEADLTNAQDFWNATGHLGEGVIVGIMDTGFQPVSFITTRLAGYENFTGDGVNAPSASNITHGTEVASAAGGNTLPVFSLASPAIQALRAAIIAHLGPANVIDYNTDADPEPEFVGIPVVGSAPFCSWYGFKIFDIFGSSSGSVILAAMERAVQLKENFNNGVSGGVNIQVLNGSFGGATLFAGQDPFFAQEINKMRAVGIVPCFAAGNGGPGGLTIGDPGAAKNILTVGATDIAAYEKIFYDAFGFPGLGDLFRANNTHQIAYFSSRGPNADGRSDPDIVAPGANIWVQSSATGFSIGSGTSYCSPVVAGAAALLLSAHPAATNNQIRGALLRGANNKIIKSKPAPVDQGFGFLDVLKAHQLLSAGTVTNPTDPGLGTSDIEVNIRPRGANVIHSLNIERSTGRLSPGERHEYYIAYDPKDHDDIDITVSTIPFLPPDQQNQLFSDDILFTVHSAKTSDFRGAEYLVGQFIGGFAGGTASFHLEDDVLDKGILRITVFGDWTNAGKVSTNLSVTIARDNLDLEEFVSDAVAEGEADFHTLAVPAGLPELKVMLWWERDWEAYPTDDIDMIVISPSGELFFDGATLDAPERLTIAAPEAGNWTFVVLGFTVWKGLAAPYQLLANDDLLSKPAPKSELSMTALPTEFGVEQNYPNPFNPSTQITYHVAASTDVKIQIFDLNGQLVNTLVSELKQPGSYTATWNGKNRHGQTVATGVYIYRLNAGSYVEQKRMTFVK